jgi:hypothetical protein
MLADWTVSAEIGDNTRFRKAYLAINLDKSKGIFEVELSLKLRRAAIIIAAAVTTLALGIPTYAQSHQGGEANLVLPDLDQVTFLNGINGHNLLLFGIVICVLGLGFGLAMYMNLQRMPVHRAMREISELIYATVQNLPDHARASSFSFLKPSSPL